MTADSDAVRQRKRIHRARRNGAVIGVVAGALLGLISPIAWGGYGLPLILPWFTWPGWNVVLPANLGTFVLLGAFEWGVAFAGIGTFVGAVNRVKPSSNAS